LKSTLILIVSHQEKDQVPYHPHVHFTRNDGIMGMFVHLLHKKVQSVIDSVLQLEILLSITKKNTFEIFFYKENSKTNFHF